MKDIPNYRSAVETCHGRAFGVGLTCDCLGFRVYDFFIQVLNKVVSSGSR